jgi:hypothetical protein
MLLAIKHNGRPEPELNFSLVQLLNPIETTNLYA